MALDKKMLTNISLPSARFSRCASIIFALATAQAFAQAVTVVEYYHRALDAYFITGRSNEQTLLDALPGEFARTGMQFTARAATEDLAAAQVRICRFYVNTTTPFANSHFYGRDGIDCESIRAQNLPGFAYEGFDFAVAQPVATGAPVQSGSSNPCAESTPLPVYRSFRAGSATRTANHRYSTSKNTYDALTAAGWSPEQVVFCVATSKDAEAAPSPSFKRVVSPPLSPFLLGCNGQFSGVNGVNYSGAEVEPSLAKNPLNPKHLLAAWQQDRWSNGGSQGIQGAVSFDGGASWSNTQAAFSLCSGGTVANGGGYSRASDPWVSIGADGTAFQMALAFSGESFTATSVNAMLVSRSTDGGRTWALPQTLARDAGAAIFHDKNMLLTDPNNAAYVYAIWGRLQANGRGPAWFTRSVNGGLSWETARAAYDPGADNQTVGNQMVALPNGTLVNVFLDIIRTNTVDSAKGSFLRVVRSADRGASWSSASTISEFTAVGTVDPTTREAVRDGSIIASIAAGIDGRLHVVWQDSRLSNGKFDSIAYAQSTDAGLTWSTPVAINARTDVAAFTPTVAARSDGSIGVSYFDFRADNFDPATLPVVYRLASSSDGVSWYDSAVEDAFELRQAPIAGGYFLGDYQALLGNGAAFSALYARTGGSVFNNATEIVFANVADGSLKRIGERYVAARSPQIFQFTPQWQTRVSANVERLIAQRRSKCG